MFEFFKIRRGLNKHTDNTSKILRKTAEACKELEKVNNGLITMDADLTKKKEMLDNISNSVNEKIETNKAVISILKEVQSK